VISPVVNPVVWNNGDQSAFWQMLCQNWNWITAEQAGPVTYETNTDTQPTGCSTRRFLHTRCFKVQSTNKLNNTFHYKNNLVNTKSLIYFFHFITKETSYSITTLSMSVTPKSQEIFSKCVWNLYCWNQPVSLLCDSLQSTSRSASLRSSEMGATLAPLTIGF